MKLIIGLGNPGDQYTFTRHNAGFIAINKLAEDFGAHFKHHAQANAEVTELNIDGEKIILAKPQTFMNKSGEAVAYLASLFNIPSNDVWVLYDEAALEFGTLRVRLDGSAGGHNGLKSIIHHLGANDFVRFRIGIGSTPEHRKIEDWVLSKFTTEERKQLTEMSKLISSRIQEAIKSDSLEGFTENLTN